MNETVLMLMLALIMIILFVIGLNGLRVRKKLEEAEAENTSPKQAPRRR